MKLGRWVAAAIVLGLVAVATVRGNVTLPPVISDNMVLQAGVPAPLFGKADPGESITIELAGRDWTTMTAKDGTWLLRTEALKPGGPFDMKIKGDKNSLTVKNVLIGEVWLASGQSNMRFTMARVAEAKAEIAQADMPEFRYLKMPSPDDDDKTVKWVVCSPETARVFSGVAYYFVRDLQPRLKVPFGIIDNSVSGATGQRFMSPQALQADPLLAEAVKKQQPDKPSDLFSSEVASVAPYAVRGTLWYQGEGNRNNPVTYRRLLPELMADWRQQWQQADMPFFIVQLANWQARKPEPSDGKDCSLREVQAQVAAGDPHSALIVSIDCGIENNVHYPNKKPVGDRLAVAARALVYGEKTIEYSGPIFKSAQFDGGKAVVSFAHLGSGLMAKGDKLTGFLLAGADKKFVRADATIQGDKVIVHADAVPAPLAVRYAWERNPDCNLYNKEGLPAAPFRSDNYESVYTRDGGE